MALRAGPVLDGAGGRIEDVGAQTEVEQLGDVGPIRIHLVDGQPGEPGDGPAVVAGRIAKVVTYAIRKQTDRPGGALIEDRPAELDTGIDPGARAWSGAAGSMKAMSRALLITSRPIGA